MNERQSNREASVTQWREQAEHEARKREEIARRTARTAKRAPLVSEMISGPSTQGFSLFRKFWN